MGELEKAKVESTTETGSSSQVMSTFNSGAEIVPTSFISSFLDF